MKQSINVHAFRDAFQAIRPDNFSYDGLTALFEWLEQLDEDCGTETELDVIALCCDFSEYTLDEINTDYSQEFEDIEEATEWLNEQTVVIPVDDDTVIIQQF